jgi:hypothetical protein
MSSRYLIALLGAAALAFACSPRGPHAPEGATAQTTARPKAKRHAARAGESALVPDLGVRVGREVELALQVVNVSDKRVEVTFPDGRTHDFVVLDSAGAEVWRWSRARMFTQALQSRTIAAGDSIGFAERWARPAGARGRYTAVAVLASENFPVEQRVAFTLP